MLIDKIIAFKVEAAEMDEALLDAQSIVLTREAAEVGSSFDNETLEESGSNTDLYFYACNNQDVA